MEKQVKIGGLQEIEGIYLNSGHTSPLAIIVNGHNGFYNYGFFPYLQESLYRENISSYSYNFSHGGVIGGADTFEDLGKYRDNCIRLEVEDTLTALNYPGFNHPSIFLIAHSLGGIPAVVSAWKTDTKIDGIILLNSVSTLDFWPEDMIREWKATGVYYKKNNRTKQDLPLGKEFLEEILNCEKDWNLQHILAEIDIPICIIHGDLDEAVPVHHGQAIFQWAKMNGSPDFHIIPGGSHTFNTKHPFEGPSPQLNEMITFVANWIKTHGSVKY